MEPARTEIMCMIIHLEIYQTELEASEPHHGKSAQLELNCMQKFELSKSGFSILSLDQLFKLQMGI